MNRNSQKISPLEERQILRDLKVAGDTLRAAHSKDQVLDFTNRTFLKLGFDRVRIWLIDREKGEFCGGKCSYAPDKFFKKIKGKLDKKTSPYLTYGLTEKKPYINKKNLLLKRFFNDNKTTETCEFPLIAGKKFLGSIGVDNAISGRSLHFQEIENNLMPFVNHIALVLHRVLIEQKLKTAHQKLKKEVASATKALQAKNAELDYRSRHDQLTGLPNRRDFDAKVVAEFKKASIKKPLSLAMLDLDFLKQVNDQAGHLAGDRVLAQVGQTLATSRSITYAARYAGDEFVVLLPGKSDLVAKKTLEQARKKIQRASGQNISIGVATNPGLGIVSPIDLIRIADDALYHAKHTGRGRTVCAGDPTEIILPAGQQQKAIQKIETGGMEINDYVGQLELADAVSKNIQHAKTVTEVAHAALKSMRKQLGCQRIRIYLTDKKRSSLQCIEAIGLAKSRLSELNLPLDAKKSVAAEATLKKRVINVVDTKKRSNFDPKTLQIFKTKAVLVIPLIVTSKAIGALVADYDPVKKQFADSQCRHFITLGNHIGLALEQRRLLTEAKGANRKLEKDVQQSLKQIKQYSHSLEQKIEDNRRLREDERQAHFDIVSALIVSIESKDFYTRGHSIRVANYAYLLGRAAGIDNKRLSNLRYGALLHDLGKLSIDRHILNKHTALTDDEIKQLSSHPAIGAKIVSSIRFLKSTARFIKHHHERWDGRGYPSRLKSTKIPLESRIINIADSYDAMITRRSYGTTMSKPEAISILRVDAGKQFDPDLVELFIKILQK